MKKKRSLDGHMFSGNMDGYTAEFAPYCGTQDKLHNISLPQFLSKVKAGVLSSVQTIKLILIQVSHGHRKNKSGLIYTKLTIYLFLSVSWLHEVKS